MKISTNLHSGWYPGGSYTQTCENIEFDADSRMLEALCQRIDGGYVYSQIYLPYGFDLGDISNCDGELVVGDCGYL